MVKCCCYADLQKKMDFDFDRITIKLGPWKFGFDLKPKQMDEMTRHADWLRLALQCSLMSLLGHGFIPHCH